MLNVTFRKNQVEKMIELLETELETMVDAINNEIDTVDSLYGGIKCNVETLISLGYEPNPKRFPLIIQGFQIVGMWDETDELDRRIIGHSIKHLHDVLVNSDQEVIDEHCNQIDCSEGSLFDRLHCLSERYDVELDD